MKQNNLALFLIKIKVYDSFWLVISKYLKEKQIFQDEKSIDKIQEKKITRKNINRL